MKTNRGGPRKGAGLKQGTKHKNALKPPSKRRTVKKQVSYTQDEFRRVTEAMVACGYVNHAKFSRDAVLNLTGMILAEAKHANRETESSNQTKQ